MRQVKEETQPCCSTQLLPDEWKKELYTWNPSQKLTQFQLHTCTPCYAPCASLALGRWYGSHQIRLPACCGSTQQQWIHLSWELSCGDAQGYHPKQRGHAQCSFTTSTLLYSVFLIISAFATLNREVGRCSASNISTTTLSSVLYAVNEGLRNILYSVAINWLSLLLICSSRSISQLSQCSNEPLQYQHYFMSYKSVYMYVNRAPQLPLTMPIALADRICGLLALQSGRQFSTSHF